MKITIVAGPSYPVPAVLGGAMSKAWELLAPEFAARGHEVVVLSRRHDAISARAADANPRFVDTWGFPQSRNISLDLARDLAYAVSLAPILPRADVILCNDFWLPALAPWLRPSAGRVFICAARHPKRQYWLYRRNPRVIALSNAVASAITQQEPRLAGRVAVVPLPVDLKCFSNSSNREPARTNRLLQYVGRVHPEKGLHLLIQAFAQVADTHRGWRLRIIGPSEAAQGGGGAAYLTQLRSLAGSAAVEFTGPMFDRQALAREYAAGDLLCYPSLAEHGEAFGVVPLESMAAGVPPIVSRLDCFTDFVQDGENGWVFDHRSNDPVQALASVLDTAIRDEGERASRGLRGRETAARHSAQQIAGRYLEEFALP